MLQQLQEIVGGSYVSRKFVYIYKTLQAYGSTVGSNFQWLNSELYTCI